MKDTITVREIQKHLKESFDIEIKECTASTNQDAKELALKGAAEGTVVISKMQTAGRGRMDREFFSPDDSGIYMSVILRPELLPEKNLLITTAAAVAVSETFDEILNINSQIKWVNDIYLNNRKVCGILTESSINSRGRMDFAVLGIGINVYKPKNGFPCDIVNKAGFLCEIETKNLKNNLIAGILEKFYKYYRNIELKEYYNTYKSKNKLFGKTVTIPDGSCAKVIDIDEDFCLVVQKDNGSIEHLMTGEVIINL